MELMWMLLFVMPALQQTAFGTATNNSCLNLGIIGGHKVQIERAPYMAALLGDDLFQCGGSIIHDWFILTSAYCCMSFINTVRVGSSNVFRKGSSIAVNRTLIHQGFKQDTFENDICLLKLQNRVHFRRYVAKVDLADEQFNINEGMMVNITGWGKSTELGRFPEVLHQTTIPVVSDKCCRLINPVRPDSMFCAGSSGHNFCNGDAGGPLTFNNVQVGIASITAPTPCGQDPAFYTKISRFYSWINSTIRSNMKKKTVSY